MDNFLFYLSLKINSMKEIFSPCDNSLMSLISTGKDELDVSGQEGCRYLIKRRCIRMSVHTLLY